MTSRRQHIAACLSAVHDLFEEQDVWHVLMYGSLLGAVRDGEVIEWDHDFDLLVRVRDAQRILELDEGAMPSGISIHRLEYPSAWLPVHREVTTFDPMHLSVLHEGVHVGDVYTPNLFEDGVLRFVDLDAEVIWTPHSSVPHWFFDETTTVQLAGRSYPAPRRPEVFLAGVYGDDWQVPYRSVVDGGEGRAGTTTHGDRYEPKLARELAWCEDQGWDRSAYQDLPRWPRPLRGAGPAGPTERTWGTSGALWWRDLDELVENF